MWLALQQEDIMLQRGEKRIARATVKRRRQEIAQCLAEFGFARGPHRLLLEASGENSHCRRLCAALVSLGPVFSLFGIYLASRVDLLSAKHCLELAAIPDRAEPTPIAVIRTLILRELGCSLTEAYLTFKESPFESRLSYQSHRAWLRDGTAVTVKIMHPELEARLACDVELLTLLESAFASEEWSGFAIERAIADFRCALRQHMDFAHEADSMDALACDSKEFEMLAVPTVLRQFCSSKVLTAESLTGSSLADVISCVTKRESWQSTMAELSWIDPNELAVHVCRVWLRQALLGNAFPVEPRPENILVLSEKRIAFTSGSFASFSPDAKTNLWNYLLAASEDPDRACSCLLKEMEEGQLKVNQDELGRKFRQIVPFRDGGWDDNSTNDSLAEHLFVQWRLANENGCRPSFHLLSFYRGLFLIAAAAQQLAPQHDSLLRGLKEVRLIELLGQVQQMIGLRPLSNDLDKYATMMMELPKKLDDVLTLASEGNTRLKLRITEGADRRKMKNSLAVSIALLIMLASVILLARHLAINGDAGPWAERIGVFLCVLIGAMLLRVASRSR
jgi:predicted unusual protein kinase regulating ubiquinone biosynthesis (AarF/ABC1/UbiB family)